MKENSEKTWIEPIPDFDLEKYPFVLCAGRAEIWIANVKTGTVQTFLTCSSQPFYAQPGMTFIHSKDPYVEPEEEKKGEVEEEKKGEVEEEKKGEVEEE